MHLGVSLKRPTVEVAGCPNVTLLLYITKTAVSSCAFATIPLKLHILSLKYNMHHFFNMEKQIFNIMGVCLYFNCPPVVSLAV